MRDTASSIARISREALWDDLRATFDLFDSVMALDDAEGDTPPSDVEQGAIMIVAQLIARKIDHRMRMRRN